MEFQVYVQDARKVSHPSRCERLCGGYLTSTGKETSFAADALVFDSEDEARAAIASRGIECAPGITLRKKTAFVCQAVWA